MPTQKIKFWNSIVSRFSLLFIGLIVSAIMISGYLVFTESSKVIREFSKDRIMHNTNLASQAFYSLIHEAVNDIALLSSTSIIEDFVADPSVQNRAKINDLFTSTLFNKPSYFQARLIRADEEGLEIVRAEKKNNRIFNQLDFKNQAKGDKDYVKETRKLQPGEYYYSKINLNEDFGKVSIPLIPTLRTASPIFDKENNIRYVLVININLLEFYEKLDNLMASGVKLILLNEDNRYLFAPNMKKCFGDQLDNDNFFYRDFDLTVDDKIAQQSGFETMHNKDGTPILYHAETLSYFQGRQKIYLLSVLEENLLFQSAYVVRNKSLLLTLLVGAVALLIALIFTRYFSKRINEITLAIGGYEETSDTTDHPLPKGRKDEIGVLAKTFSRMKARIDQQMKDLNSSLKKEKAAIQERDEFLQNMSHELRTPLNAILGLTQLLEKNNPTEEQKPIIQSLHRSANNLAGLVYDVLDHQKILEGKIHLHLKPENISDLLHDIHASYQYEAVNKGLKLDLQTDSYLSNTEFNIDALRFNQVVTNLVVNAIRYTEQGSISIKGKRTEKSEIVITVEDTGIGINSNDLKKLNERFYQVHTAHKQTSEGFGLGLSIVTQLVGLFGGRLDVQSQPDQGSVFKITLPVSEVTAPDDINKKSTSIPLPNLSDPIHILHIEDDESAQMLLRGALASKQILITQIAEKELVESAFEKQKFDLIISDVMINQNSIQDFLTQFVLEHPELPLIALSALGENELQRISSFHLQKPFDIQSLIDLVYQLAAKQEFDQPILEEIYALYDQQPEKIVKYLGILIKEFEQYKLRLEDVFESKDQKEWQAINHKIITHVKGLKLEKMANYLTSSVDDLEVKSHSFIINDIAYLLCFFRVERRLNSKDLSS